MLQERYWYIDTHDLTYLIRYIHCIAEASQGILILTWYFYLLGICIPGLGWVFVASLGMLGVRYRCMQNVMYDPSHPTTYNSAAVGGF